MSLILNRLTGFNARTIDPDVISFIRRVRSNGGDISQRTIDAVNRFVMAAKGKGYWDKLLRINLICGSNLAAALTPLVVGSAGGTDSETNVNFVSGDFVETGNSTAGLKGNGTSKYLNTGWNPVTQGWSTSSCGLWAYVKGTDSGGTSRQIMGNYANVGFDNFSCLGWVSGGAREAGTLAGTTGTYYSPTPSISTSHEGFLGIVCNGSRTQRYYRNGSEITTAVVSAGAGFANYPFFVMAINAFGSPATYANQKYLRAYAFTSGLSATDAANFNNDLQNFQTVLSRKV